MMKMSRERINERRSTEDRLLDIVEYFIGMRTTQDPTRAPQEGFSRPDPRSAPIPLVDFSVPTDEEEQAQWEYQQGIINARELEAALRESKFLNAEIEIEDP